MPNKVISYEAKVMPDGHISAPAKLKLKPGTKLFITASQEKYPIYEYAEGIAKKKGIKKMSLNEVVKIIHESRGIED